VEISAENPPASELMYMSIFYFFEAAYIIETHPAQDVLNG